MIQIKNMQSASKKPNFSNLHNQKTKQTANFSFTWTYMFHQNQKEKKVQKRKMVKIQSKHN